jgi:mersacidin/lichenicidin family type 2 lantibiotic
MDLVKAWKDPEYRLSLSATERAGICSNPVGFAELSDTDLDDVGGAEAAATRTGTCCRTTITFISHQLRCATVHPTVCNGTCCAPGGFGCC